MPIKPTQDVIDAHKKKLDPRAVLNTIINETPILKDELLKAGLVQEVKEGAING